MNTSVPNSRHSTYYSVDEAAWLLGVPRSIVSRAIRTGAITIVRRRSGLAVPAHVLTRLLDVSQPEVSGHD
jgi:excisionase family DNA binding protein